VLVLTRKAGERVVIGGSIVVQVLGARGSWVRIGVQAPPGVTILRRELILGTDTAVVRPGGESPPGKQRRVSKRGATRSARHPARPRP
jgi:carbon storage regulator